MTLQTGLQAMKLQDLKSKSPHRSPRLRRRSRDRERLVHAQAGHAVRDLKELAERNVEITGTGVVETLQDAFGFLRSPESNYLPGPRRYLCFAVSDPPLRPAHRRHGRRPDRSPKDGERYFALLKVTTINFEDPEQIKHKVHFDNLTPLYPTRWLNMELTDPTNKDKTGRVIDIVAPQGMGQRALITAQPRTGKTVILQNIAKAISANHPECFLIVLLIDERPEEVTDMQRSVKGEVIASTFDEPATRHVQVAEMVIEKAKRLVEHKRDVVICWIRSPASAALQHRRSKLRQGADRGVDANALQRPKRFFGAARNIEEGGSLTIIATALDRHRQPAWTKSSSKSSRARAIRKLSWTARSPTSASSRPSTSCARARARMSC